MGPGQKAGAAARGLGGWAGTEIMITEVCGGEMGPIRSDERIRFMRDSVYGRPSTGSNWEGCQHKWKEPEELSWLCEQFESLIAARLKAASS